MPRLLEHYRKNVVPKLMEEFKFKSPMQVPTLEKIVINIGMGEATQNSKVVQYAEYTVQQIAGQKPVLTRSKKAISNFKLRKDLAIGCMVTLRRDRMWEFLDRVVAIALPRVRDFKGIPHKRGFDGRGSYTLGVKESIIFPEINVDKLDKIRGMNITFVTSATNDDQGRALLGHMGMPFRKD